MDSEYAARYRDLYERHWWWRARERYVISQLDGVLSGCPQTNVLDVGCGDGLMFEPLSRFGHVEGVEIDASIVSEAGPLADRIFVQPFDETFDQGRRYGLIVIFDALEHMPDPERSLRRAFELLDHDGIVVITVPAFNALWTGHDDLNAHTQRFTKKSLEALVDRSGGRIVQSNYFFQWLAPVKLALRAKETVFGEHGGHQPRIPAGWINAMLVRLSRIEQRTISRLPVPFGSSLFAVISPEHHLPESSTAVPAR
jgi:SAM-dependent methyltransferase